MVDEFPAVLPDVAAEKLADLELGVPVRGAQLRPAGLAVLLV